MANKTILSTVYNNQELLWKITSGLNVKSNAISGAVSGILADYDNLKGTTAGIATTLLDLSENTQKAIEALSATDTGVIDTRINAASTVLDGKITAVDGKVDTLSGQVVDAFGEGAKVVVSKDGGITKSEAIIGGATLADTALSTTLATEAAVRNAIDTKSISLVGHEAIGVSGGLDKTAYLKIDGNDKYLTQSDDGLLANIAISSVTGEEGTEIAKKYFLVGKNGAKIEGSDIDIPKDRALSGISYDETTKKLTIVVWTASGTTASSTINLSGLIDVYSGASGIAKIDGNTFVGVVDGNSESYLTVGADGFKLSGVKDAIDAASAYAYDTAVTSAKSYTDTEIEKADTGAAALSGRVKVLEDTLSGTDGVIAQLAAEITNRETAVSNARTDLSAYVDAVSAVLGADIHTVSSDLGTEVERAKAAETYVSGTLSGAIGEGFDSTNTVKAYVDTAVTSARTDLSAYVDAEISNISATIGNDYVTKEVFGDVASNTKADNELLANKYEDLETKLNTLLGNI